MVKVIKNKEYYRQFEELMRKDTEEMQYHGRMADYYKRKYESTKGKGGFYALMNMLARQRNEYHVSKGAELALSCLRQCSEELVDLSNYIEACEQD